MGGISGPLVCRPLGIGGSSVEQDIILALKDITKIYPGVVALDHVSVEFRRGEIHALCGENGAGKSTLIKVITGAIQPEHGKIVLDGTAYSAITPALARASGIEAIYQEYNLVDTMSAAENISFGQGNGKFVNYKAMNEAARQIFDRFGVDIDPKTLVRNLTSAKRQIVEIAKAVSKNARLLIMDEPTAPLTNAEIEILMDIIAHLKREGVTIIYISHRLDEIFRIADRVTVFQDGQYVTTMDIGDTNRAQLIKYMVGRELSEAYPCLRKKTQSSGVPVLEVRNLTGNGVKNISFQVQAGEILGIAGLVGAGRSEIMKVLVGAEQKQWGKVLLGGKEVEIKSPAQALEYGIGLVPEDRKREGCFLLYGVNWNIVISCIRKISRGLFIDRRQEKRIAETYVSKLRIKTPSGGQKVLNLSGGNQQKVVIAKTLAVEPTVLIFDEPTRGIDVGAKHEIYELMDQLCAEGKAIIMISSDMEELLGMSDRITVLYEKQLSGNVPADHMTQEYILEMASGSPHGSDN